jgi:hypothetical protein
MTLYDTAATRSHSALCQHRVDPLNKNDTCELPEGQSAGVSCLVGFSS